MQHERDALGRGHRLEHDEERHADRLIQGDPVGRVRRAARPLVPEERTLVSTVRRVSKPAARGEEAAPDEDMVREHSKELGEHHIDVIHEIAGDVSPEDLPDE